MNELSFSSVTTTLPDIDSANAMARKLLESRLAACANIVRLNSMYWWEDKIEERGEYAVILKIRSSDFDSVRMAILQGHPYDLPMVIRHSIDDGNPQFLDWIYKSTNVPKPKY
jgi:periplasmic divalent cation tolerance protein